MDIKDKVEEAVEKVKEAVNGKPEQVEEDNQKCKTCGRIDAPKTLADNEEFAVCPACGGAIRI